MIYGVIHDIALISLSPLLLGWITLKYKNRIKRGISGKLNTFRQIYADIIIHSSSIGETKNALLFSKEIKKIFPEKKIIHSVFTETAHRSFPETFLMPPPLFSVQRTLITTKNLIFFESDIWPSYILSVKSKNGKVVVVSGKISEKSAKMWRTIPILRKSAEFVDHVFAKDKENQKRFKYAGFPSVSCSVELKNLIFLQEKKKVKLNTKNKVLFGLSTRGSEEIKFLIELWKTMNSNRIKTSLIIAPRHDFHEAEEILNSNSKMVKITEIISPKREKIEEVKDKVEKIINENIPILVDIYGYTEEILKITDICFVGGTISPIGGHNVAEPLSFKIPTIIGPHNWNIQKELLENLFVIKNPQEINYFIKKINEKKQQIEKFISKKSSEIRDEILKIASYLV